MEKVQDLLSTNRAAGNERSQPFFALQVTPPFTITGIEVHGYSYPFTSGHNKTTPFWEVEKENPGQAIEERIETENILLFYSADGRRLLLKPVGAVFWFLTTFENEAIEKLLVQKSVEGNRITRLKMSLGNSDQQSF